LETITSRPSPEDILIGSKVTENRHAADAASPGAQIEKLPGNVTLPSILLMHGTADSIVSPRQSQRLYNTLMQRDQEADVTLVLVEGTGHGGDRWKPMVKQAIDYLRPRLGLSEAQ
jgi:predicted esterase